VLFHNRPQIRLQSFDGPLAGYVDLVIKETENVRFERRANQLAEQFIVVRVVARKVVSLAGKVVSRQEDQIGLVDVQQHSMCGKRVGAEYFCFTKSAIEI
jgi:hypothetical protein